MNNKPIKVLLVEDNSGDVLLIQEILSETQAISFEFEQVERLSDGLTRLTGGDIDIVLLNLSLPDSSGLDTFIAVCTKAPEIPIVILTGLHNEKLAVEAMQAGAQDYLVKGQFEQDLLARAIRYAIERQRLVTDLTRRTTALLRSEACLHNLIEHNADAMVIVDENGLIRFVNPAAETLFGCLADELVGNPFGFPVVVGEKIEIEIQRHDVDETLVAAEMNVVETNWEDEPAFLASLSDITDRKKAGALSKDHLQQIKLAYEQSIVYAQELKEEIAERKRIEAALAEERALLAHRVEERTAELNVANAELARAARLKDEFLANMSHELRTPLNAVLGMSEILGSEVYGPLNPEQLRALSHIEEGGRHLLNLINDILDLSKIEAGEFELNIGSVWINDICQASLQFIKQMAQKKEIKVFSNFDDTLDRIQADERRLKQILVNLLSNAVKFTPEGGQVGLEVKGDATHEVAHFIVWDTGIGIAQKDMDNLFKPFIQIDSHLSRQHEGTGLGLSLVSRLAEMHQGGLSVESEVGKGSRFTVSLPWQSQRGATEGQGRVGGEEENGFLPSTSTPEYSCTILLAEDNETNIVMTRDILQAKGHKVIVARNGLEAIEQARENRPDVILMDIQMPELDGLEATRRIRADEELAAIPIIALTALAMPGDRERCLAAGANEYLSKPISFQELIETIKTQLQRVIPRK